MSAILLVRHTVADYPAWRKVYDEVEPLRVKHGYTGARVFQLPGDANDVFAYHDFPTVEQANAFASDPELAEGMQRAGVVGAPRIEIFDEV